MLIWAVAACAVLGACVLGLLAVRRSRIRADRRLGAVLTHLDEHLAAMSTSVARAVEAVVEAGGRRPFALLTLDFDELLDTLVREAARRTRADAVVLRVEGPGGRPVVATHGAVAETDELERSFAPPGPRRYEAALVDWTYTPAGDPADEEFQSALVLPLAAPAGMPGALAAYAYARDAFGPAQAGELRTLLRDLGVALANARRFSELEARVNVDPVTGARNRRGYELELGREVARAERTGRPLAVVVVGVAEEPDSRGRIGDVARLVSAVTRRGDISCRRGESELAVLLPGTEEAGASVLTRRIEDEARRRLAAGTPTMTVGVVSRRPDESPESFDARIDAVFGRARGASVSALEDARNASTAHTSTMHSVLAGRVETSQAQPGDALRRDALATIAGELGEARSFGRSLALVALEVDGLEELEDRAGREPADATLASLAGRLDRSIGSGSAHRLGTGAFALVLPGSGLHEAEALVDALQSQLEPPHDAAGLVLSAGITEAAEGDDAEAALGRAEHALWQARQAGPGTVVVAVPGKRPTPPG